MVKSNLVENVAKLRPRHRRIRAISIAPALLTLGNLLSGFAAIHFAARPDYTIQNPLLQAWLPTNLAIACYLIFAAMLCDALDGRLARFARTTSDFGGQLDSLADVVSFGAAPAFIVIRLVMRVFTILPHAAAASQMAMHEEGLIGPVAGTAFGRFCWIAAGAYLACAALRLARFNAENVPDESAHMSFKGLPTPAAAGALIAVILLNEEVTKTGAELAGSPEILAKIIPWLTIILGLLMVSRLPYSHIINRYLRGKKPFWMLVAGALGILAFLMWPRYVLAIALCGYAAGGPVAWIINLRKRKDQDSLTVNYTTSHE
ncbi:MAG: CDP-alcohol phosphatidyltransferase family protein [Phycisphaerae bacterium]